MTRVLILIACLLASSQLALAKISVHDFNPEAKHRSQELQQLIAEVSATYPKLANLKLATEENELKAILGIGRAIVEARESMFGGMKTLEQRVDMLDNRRLTVQESKELIESLKTYVQELTSQSGEIKVLVQHATKAYQLAKQYEPAPNLRTDWYQTWRAVKRLVPHHL